MKNLLGKLIMQAKTDARDVLRQLISTLNGLAGVHILGSEVGVATLSHDSHVTVLMLSMWVEPG